MPDDTNFFVDLSLVVPPRKVFRLVGGERPVDVDVSVFPARAMLKFMQVMDGKAKGSAPSIEEMVSVVAEAIRPKNPEITEEWLFDNLTFNQLSDFCGLVMEYGQQQMDDYNQKFTPKNQGGGESKNLQPQPSSSTSGKSSRGQHQNTASKK